MLDLYNLEEICKKYSGKLLSLVISSRVYLQNQMRFVVFPLYEKANSDSVINPY